jgi:copper chaperone CopZ
MAQQTFTIPRISCGHCVNAIKSELAEVAGVQSVNGDPGRKTVEVAWEAPATEQAIRAKLQEINYPAQ